MGAVQKRSSSTRRKGKRRINHKVATKELLTCEQCESDKLAHQACPKCGHY